MTISLPDFLPTGFCPHSVYVSVHHRLTLLTLCPPGSHAATLQRRQDREDFFLTTQGVVQLVQRYRSGIRGRLKSVVQDLLRVYLQVTAWADGDEARGGGAMFFPRLVGYCDRMLGHVG